MTAAAPSPAVQGFVDYFGELGPRWGLPADACRVHAYLYLAGRPVAEADIATALRLDSDAAARAFAFLADYRMIDLVGPGTWSTGGDPWDMMMGGLRERRRREVGPALETLRECQRRAGEAADRGVTLRIGRILTLVEDLAALDTQADRLSPQILKGLVGMSGAAARLAGRAFGRGREETP